MTIDQYLSLTTTERARWLAGLTSLGPIFALHTEMVECGAMCPLLEGAHWFALDGIKQDVRDFNEHARKERDNVN